ncbi:Protein kinase [Sorangium cellulosum So ce56]|uniref:Protein kinase n=1 Tax=Sorangium cellulosum (strain So ce56) TaxID=448385 RepID=A9ETI8_SORC5|nr:protein kinase [Sorangium cellulosum]CAN91012.1 Protein kinase [Sorangium cellulosum So ce56]
MTSRGVLPESVIPPPSEVTDAPDEKQRARARLGMTVKNKWRIDSLLGVGGMASVYAATHHRNGSRAALKILHAEFARDVGIRERFLREGYVANKIDHPGRVAILDDDITEQDEPFLVMELLDGETVQQLWKRKSRKLPVAEALWIAGEVLLTLESFHAEGIVHRDLKPANIFITKDNVVKLLDFGVARMRGAPGDKTKAGTALGTPSFMAPEQAMGLTEGVDGRADLFSIGATLYAVLSGQRLHQGRSDNEAFILAATTPAPSLARIAPELPASVIGLVDKALAWDKRNRFESAAQMRQEVLRVLEEVGASVPRRSSPTSTRRPPPDDSPTAVGMRAAEEPAPHDEPGEAEPDDPAVTRLTEVFRRMERLLPAVRHYGWTHPDADNKLRATFQAIVEALRADGSLVHWTLTPYAFEHRRRTVWEPSHPLDLVPYNLFAAGVRRVQLLPGITEDELRALCEVLLLDPLRDLAPEDDVAAALWERRLEHVRYDVVSVFVEGDAADREQFWHEADDLEGMARRAAEEKANRAEAAAMVIDTDAAALRAARRAASALALDPVAQRALGTQLVMSPDRWSERFVEVVADAFLNARRYKDVELVTEPMAASARDLILARRFEVLFGMHDAIEKALDALAPRQQGGALATELARGMFPPDTMRLLLREATRIVTTAAPGGAAQPAPVDLDLVAQRLAPILHKLGSETLPVAMEVVGHTGHEALRRALLGHVERTLPGHEEGVVDALMTLDLDVARPILKMFAASRTQGALGALKRLSGCANAALRCEAIAHLATSPEQIRDELLSLAESAPPDVRVAALRTLAHHQVRAAGPLLVRRVQDSSFHQLTLDERREFLGALYTLNPARGESVAVELLQRHGLLADDAAEQTRCLSAELLGREARSQEALDAALAASKRRPWNSQALRDAAGAAAEAIAARLGKRISTAGEVP